MHALDPNSIPTKARQQATLKITNLESRNHILTYLQLCFWECSGFWRSKIYLKTCFFNLCMGVVDSRQIFTVDYASPHDTRRTDCKENGFPFGRLLVTWLWWWSSGSWNLWNSNRQPKMSRWSVAKRGNVYSPVHIIFYVIYTYNYIHI